MVKFEKNGSKLPKMAQNGKCKVCTVPNLSAASLAVSQWNEERPASSSLSSSDLRFLEAGETTGAGSFLLLRNFFRVLDSGKGKKNNKV